jgi:hypothetical protein
LASQAGQHSETTQAVVGGVVSGLVGALLAGLGTVWHHALVQVGSLGRWPVGLVLASLVVAGWSTCARAWRGYVGLLGAVAGVFLVTQALAQLGPGGDVVIQGDKWGYAWLILAPVAALVPAFIRRKQSSQSKTT